MRIDNNRGISLASNFPRESKSLAEHAATGKNLVPLAQAASHEDEAFRRMRTLATFVAQLIAKSQDAPHMRERRRADPAEAAAAYRKMLNLGGVPKRHKARPF